MSLDAFNAGIKRFEINRYINSIFVHNEILLPRRMKSFLSWGSSDRAFYPPATNPVSKHDIRFLEEKVLFLTVNHYRIAITRPSAFHSGSRAEISYRFDLEGSSVSPNDCFRCHSSCGIKIGIDFHIYFLRRLKSLRPHSTISTEAEYIILLRFSSSET